MNRQYTIYTIYNVPLDRVSSVCLRMPLKPQLDIRPWRGRMSGRANSSTSTNVINLMTERRKPAIYRHFYEAASRFCDEVIAHWERQQTMVLIIWPCGDGVTEAEGGRYLFDVLRSFLEERLRFSTQESSCHEHTNTELIIISGKKLLLYKAILSQLCLIGLQILSQEVPHNPYLAHCALSKL